ncbi:predicted protein [Plenodomus lingam JN3]|uniref:Secreted protein n=1 Tax=Leptosphaeria maculans (strain JN3 / isolate v23.1.3 / race Av1-4-5-6-7-8) TaxID=985895 RepID=E4ZG41_LEPMJ|nr:predicted protein [Plenodomus lingam JN3]CBX90261.1 predicted protein [Plenodomus lingam JN3]
MPGWLWRLMLFLDCHGPRGLALGLSGPLVSAVAVKNVRDQGRWGREGGKVVIRDRSSPAGHFPSDRTSFSSQWKDGLPRRREGRVATCASVFAMKNEQGWP